MVERDEQAVIANSQKNLDKALHGFLNTEFMQKYKNLKIEAESLAATFKAQSARMAPGDVALVKNANTRIVDKFNRQLIEIKRDFLDKKKLKLIRKNKEMYSNSHQFNLRELQDAYSQDFERVVAKVTGSDMYAAIPLAAIFGLIKLAKDFTEFLARSNFEARRVKEEHLNQYFIEPYSFRSWFEIEMLEGDIYNNFDSDIDNGIDPEQMDENWDNTDPFEVEVDDAPSSNKKKTKKSNKGS